MRFLPRALLGAAALFVVVAACQQGSDPLVVCARPNLGFLTIDDSGKPRGIEQALLSDFAASQGRELVLEWEDSFAEVLPAVAAGECDLAASAITVTPERSQIVDFSKPYFPVRAMVAEPVSLPPLGPEDLEGETVAAVGGTTHAAILEQLGAEVLAFTEDEDLFRAVAEGEARALVHDSVTLLQYVDDYPALRIGTSISDRSFFAFATKKGDPLKEELDAYLGDLSTNEIYRSALAESFGDDAVTLILSELH